LRVTFITHYSDLYGANRSLLNLIDGLRGLGVEPSVICRVEGALSEELAKRDIPFRVFPFEWWLLPPQPKQALKGMVRFLNNVRLLPAMMRQVKQWQSEIIYSNSSETPIGALLAKSLGKPHVWHIREFGQLDYHLRHDFGEPFFRYWLNRAAEVIAISRSIKEEVLRGVRSRVHVIYNGVITASDLQRLADSDTGPKREADGFAFAIAGLIHPPKGQKEAIEALALVHRTHPEAELLVAGTGKDEYVRQMENLARDLGIAPRVRFLGFVDDIYSVFNQVDAVLMCSPFEAMGRVTAEAMAAGKPIIGFNSAGTAEIIDHENTGLLYNGGRDDLAACMGRLIENPELVYELGRNARKKAREEFTVETYAKNVYKILATVAVAKAG